MRLPADEKGAISFPFHWSELEATGEVRTYRLRGIEVFTEQLLQMRPDLTSVLSISVNPTTFTLLYANVVATACTPPVPWDAKQAGSPLCAWILRLYALRHNGTVKRDNLCGAATFTITVKEQGAKEKSYGGLSVLAAGYP